MFEDLVNHPKHYTDHTITIEPIDLLEELPFAEGNCLKYVFRAKSKGNELLDLKKASFYYDRGRKDWGWKFPGYLSELAVLRFSDVQLLQELGESLHRCANGDDRNGVKIAWRNFGILLRARIKELEHQNES